MSYEEAELLWRNEECYLAGDSPRGTLEGFPRYLNRSTQTAAALIDSRLDLEIDYPEVANGN